MCRKQIIIIDDEAYMFGSLVEDLEDEYDVTVVNTHATEGLEHLGYKVSGGSSMADDDSSTQVIYNLIILDLMMPPGPEGSPGGLLEGRNEFDAGLGLYEIIRRGEAEGIEWATEAKVLVLTADNSRDTRKELMAIRGGVEGRNLWVEYKPVPSLLVKIKRLIEKNDE
jgi:CheY-like chemotaxis protein